MNDVPSPTRPLAGKYALVTGAATGLGKQVATQLVQEGATVAVLGRTRHKLEELAKDLGSSIVPVPADVSDPDQVGEAFARVEALFGKLDILVNNAAVYIPFRIEQATDEGLQRIVNTNLLGPLYCIRAAVPLMKTAGGGDILNISSESTRNPFPYLTVYAASKGGLETLSAGLRTELREYGIRVGVLRTGSMKGDDANASLVNWTEKQLQEALALWQKTGHAAYTGEGMETATVARMVIHALSLPREALLELAEIRSS
jgi:NAD(P)-dependent dehydrogenase (short-subunit alcohol dehydrogenase family)